MGKIREHIDGVALSVADGVADAKRVFILTEYTTPAAIVEDLGEQVTDADNALQVITLPKIGDPHPDFPNILFASSYDLVKLPKAVNSWKITWKYRFNQPTGFFSDITKGPDQLGFREVTARCTGKFDMTYRANPDFSNGVPTGDIGGEPVDINGQPVSMMRTQYEIQVNDTVNDNITNVLGTYGDQVGSVCGGSVFGLPGNAVLYRGASLTRIAQNAYRLTHTYLYDQWFHTLQAAEYTRDGMLNLDTYGQCVTVYAVQPFNVGSAQNFI